MLGGSKKSVRANGNGDRPVVDAAVYIDASAQIIGNVVIGAEVFVVAERAAGLGWFFRSIEGPV